MALVLYYHSIGNSPLSVPTQAFREHLRQIKNAKLCGVSLSQMLLARPEERNGLVAITFDDCFLDVFENALPLLLEFSFSATCYAVPGYDGITRWGNPLTGRWSDSWGAGFETPFRYMGSSERKQAFAAGMEIGCHTMSHRNLDTLAYQTQYDEIVNAKKFLETELNTTITSFCFPRGRFNSDTLKIVAEAGFSSACTTHPDYLLDDSNNLEIPRYGVGADSEIFASVLCGRRGLLPIRRRVARKLKRFVGKYFNSKTNVLGRGECG
jgi:peptidoglycan/xylan/chitin deacetylase (PgdA/CDA1 family)